MSVDDSKTTKRVLKAAKFCKEWIDNNWRGPIGALDVNDGKFPDVLLSASYAAAVFSDVGDCIRRINEKEGRNVYIPSRGDLDIVKNVCKEYATGNKAFTRNDIYTIGKVCSALVNYVNSSASNPKEICVAPVF
jgi:hypothetical protein